jgi:hypothetical protein
MVKMNWALMTGDRTGRPALPLHAPFGLRPDATMPETAASGIVE